jgi:hypothetical protein
MLSVSDRSGMNFFFNHGNQGKEDDWLALALFAHRPFEERASRTI